RSPCLRSAQIHAQEQRPGRTAYPLSAKTSTRSGYRRDVPDRQSKRWLPDDALVAATDWLWLGQTLGELVEPLFAEGRLEAWVFAPAGVPDEDLKSYSGATNATD